MKKQSVLLLLLLCGLSLMAAPVKQNEATLVASNFWSAVSSQSVESMRLVPETGFAQFYVFDVNQGSGFVIVSADDVAYPILGYSTNSPAGDLGPETRFWLGQYEAEIAALVEGTVEVEPALKSYVRDQWLLLRMGTWQPPKNATTVSQMLTTQWNQSPYYNALCPSGCPVGCTATATAQIMKYWNHPVVGNGSHSYYSNNYGMLSADFDSTTYDWDNMPNRISGYSTNAQIMAVATLSYHVGVAVEMDYSPSGSGASVLGYGASSQTALVEYFNYENTLTGIYKSNYNDLSWVSALTDELDEGRPILYAGYDSEAGHAFVFDGYNGSSQFHVNWGWGGSYDGYFSMGALNPGGGGVGTNTSNTFNYYNQALIGIQPKPRLAATPSSLTFDVNGGTTSFEVRSDFGVTANWNATTDASWITLSPTTGSGSGNVTTVQATVAATTAAQPRTATITIIQGTDTLLVPVNQHACQNSDMCTLTVNMTDRTGDGWDGAYLSFANTHGVVFGKATLRSGTHGSQTVQVCPDTVIVTWHGSTGDAQCSYYIENAEGILWLEHEQGADFASADTIVSPCAATGGRPTYTYTLELEPNDTAFGSVMGADSNIRFGEYRTIQANANPGYRFVRWSDNVYENPREVLLTRDRALTARFADLGDDTVQYDNGVFNTAYDGSSDFAWGIRVGVEDLVGRPEITGVKFYCPSRGRYTVTLYQNAANSPVIQVHSQTVNLTYYYTGKWYYMTFDSPVAINHARPLWIVVSSPNANSPAVTSFWCGNEDGGWFTDGDSWTTLGQLSTPIRATWMVRGVMPLDPNEYVLTVTSTRPSWGTVTGGGRYRYGEQVTIEATPAEGCHFVRWSDKSTVNPRVVSVKSDSIIRAVFAEGEVGIDDLDAEGISLTVEGQHLKVNGADGLPLSVYDVMGRCVYSAARYDAKPVRLPAAGVYMVRVGEFLPRRVVVATR